MVGESSAVVEVLQAEIGGIYLKLNILLSYTLCLVKVDVKALD